MNEPRTVFRLLGDLVAHLRLILALTLGAAVITSVIVLVMPATYESSVSFVPENPTRPRLPAGLAGLASQLGVGLGEGASRSPAFYADLARSREVLAAALGAKIPNPHGRPDSVTVYDLYGIPALTPERQLEDGVKLLRKRITVAVDQRTDVVQVKVEAPDPTAARDVAQLLLRQVTEFNVDTRQSIARNRRQFVEGRVAAAEHDLQSAEDALRDFYSRNRQWETSPRLHFEEQRLNRQVAVQQELYLTLRREYETARIEEVNNTPVLTVIDEPQIPGRRLRPRRTLTVLLITFLTGLLACGLAVMRERHRELLAAGDPEYLRLQRRMSDFRRRLPRLAK